MAHKDKVFLDTGALYAYFDKSDANYSGVSDYINNTDAWFFTTNYIIDELITLLRYRRFDIIQIKSYIEGLWNESFCTLLYTTADIERKAWKMMNKYSDHLFSFTDCTSFILMKENLIKKACSFDSDFRAAGFIVVP